MQEVSFILHCKHYIITLSDVQSLLLKVDEVRAILMDTKFPIILSVSEVWLDPSVMDGELNTVVYCNSA